MILESLTLRKYHQICALHLDRYRSTTIATPIHVDQGTVVLWPSTNRFEDSVAIAFSPNVNVYPGQWEATGGTPGERTEGGWTRFSTSDVFDSTLTLRCFLDFFERESWLTQADYIFSRLHMTSNFEDCVLLDQVDFEVKILPTTDEPRTGFLFLCPEKDFQIGPFSFCWPDCPAYWSLDPSGVERLSAEEATDFGFPSLELTTRIVGYSWETSVYAGIREFQRAKGFDPESQDVARHLGHQLLYPFNETDAPFAHVNEEEEYSSSEDDEDQTDTEEEDSSIDVEDEKEDDQMDLEEQDEDQMDLSW
ncbi:hypothetical protein B0H19DRAFT_709837 [Mycena capillaripes]|nr:hypothetical protein B0H19DRAFT_709837 [Mycena capillaripes]